MTTSTPPSPEGERGGPGEVMWDDWMPAVVLPLTPEQFQQLPRNPAYKYEYGKGEGTAHLTPRPKTFHAVLDMTGFEGAPPPDNLTLRPLQDTDWQALPGVFAAAFHRAQPFAGLDDQTRQRAARQCLTKTRSGGDGPLIAPACFVAEADRHLVGGVLTTLVPCGAAGDWSAYTWSEPPPLDAVARRLGRAHLTWIFAAPLHRGRGLGSALLGAAAVALARLGFRELFSTFLLGNDATLLWHWRNGFRLLPYPGSRRALGRAGFGQARLA